MVLAMMIGIPGSGKSTFAKAHLQGEYLSSDDLRDELGKINIWDEMLQRTEAALSSGKDVIYDATSIKKKDRESALRIARKYGASKTAYVMLTPYEKCLTWNCKRSENRVVPEDVIKRMHDNYEPPTNEEFDEIIYINR